MTNATLIIDSARPAIRLERRLADPPAVVWRALTEREQLQSWFPCDVFVEGGDWKVGATISFPFPENVIDLTLEGEVLEVDEPHVLSYTWGDETLRFELLSEDDGTLLVLIDELEPDAAARNAAGWEFCLDRLAKVEPGDPWGPRFDAYTVAFEPALGPQEGPPPGYKGN